MNTENYIKISEESIKQLKLIHPPQLSEQERDIIKENVNVTRDFIEINQLFNIFLFNTLALEDTFILNYNDKLIRTRYVEYDCDDLILLNSLTINYISSGVTFTKSLEDYFKHNINNRTSDKFKENCLSQKYDTCFSYRLFDLLRNYSQHGHLIVNYDLNGYCFDLNQIANNPYFNYKKIMYNEMKKIIKDLLYEIGEYPRIAFSWTIAEYKVCLSEIYLDFLKAIEYNMFEKYKKFNELLENRPEIVNKSNYEEFNDTIVYDIDDENIQIAKIGNDLMKMFNDTKNKVIDMKNEDQKIFNEIKGTFKKDIKFDN